MAAASSDSGKRPYYYAVRAGSKTGVYRSWQQARAHVDGVAGAQHRRYRCPRAADAYVRRTEDDEDATDAMGCRCVDCARAAAAVPNVLAPSDVRHTDDDMACRCADCVPAAAAVAPPPPIPPLPEPAPHTVRVFTDGAASRNGKPDARGGVGVWFAAGDARNVAAPFDFALPVTNQRAELAAVIIALATVLGPPPPPPDDEPDATTTIDVWTDSRYAIAAVDDRRAWRTKTARRGASGRLETAPLANLDLMRALAALVDEASRRSVRIAMHWVKAHRHNAGNVDADALAVAGARADASRRLVGGEPSPWATPLDDGRGEAARRVDRLRLSLAPVIGILRACDVVDAPPAAQTAARCTL